jgi:hypothetical protein
LAIQRFLPDDERIRRGAGWILLVFAAACLAFDAWAVRRVNITSIIMVGVPLALLAIGFRLAFRRRELFEIDLESRTYRLVRNGSDVGSGPLDSLGPLAVESRAREMEAESSSSSRTRYVVRAAVHKQIEFYSMSSAGKARSKMQALARAWRLPSQSLGGEVIAPEHVGQRLHERLRGDSRALAARTLQPSWGVSIASLPSGGYALASTHRSLTGLRNSVLFLAVAAFVLWRSRGDDPLVSMFREPSHDLVPQVLKGLFGVVMLVLLWVIGQGVRDTFFPGTVRIAEDGVSYRGSRMKLDEIEEVIAGAPIELLARRRILRIGETFCPRQAIEPVAHELQRLIVDVASKRPL